MNTSSNEAKKGKKKKKKCNHPECKKNIDLMPFKCKCGKVFCVLHKYPENHACTFDFRSVTDLEKTKIIDQKCSFEKIKLI